MRRNKELLEKVESLRAENALLKREKSYVDVKIQAIESDLNRTTSDYNELKTRFYELRTAVFESVTALDELEDIAFPNSRRASIVWHNINDTLPRPSKYVLVCRVDGTFGIEYVYSSPEGDPEFLHKDGCSDVLFWSDLPADPRKLECDV